MEWSDTALVLNMGRFRENDIWLRLLTRRHGIVSAFAFGGSRSRKRFCGCLDLFNELQISTKTTRNGMYLSLQEGTLLHGPCRLRSDWKRLGMLMNCVRFLEALGVPPDNASETFSLLKEVLDLLEQADEIQEILPFLFRLRLASTQGYAPAFSACAQCGSQTSHKVDFVVSEGIIVCPSCRRKNSVSVEISNKTLDVLRRVQEESPLEWNFLDTSDINGTSKQMLLPAQRRECARAIDGFVQYHLGLVWEKGRFRRI